MTSRTTETHQEPPETRLKECRPCTHPDPYKHPCPWTITLKLLTNSPPGWDTQFWGHQTPLPGKTIKLFFSTSPQILYPEFNLAPVHRGRLLTSPSDDFTQPPSLFRMVFKQMAKRFADLMKASKGGPRLHAVLLDPCWSPKKACPLD